MRAYLAIGMFFTLLASCAQNTSRKSTARTSPEIIDEAEFDEISMDIPESSQALENTKNVVSSSVATLSPGARFLYAINPDYQFKFYDGVYFLDLFDTSTSRIQTVKSRGNRVICYFSAGSHEDWRPDASSFPSSARGRNLDGWAGERWLDYRNSSVVGLMKKRIQLAKQKGCDGVDPDNVDGHLNSTGFSLSASDQYNYLSALSAEARRVGIKIGLKNSPETISRLEPLFDWVVAEECATYNECSAYYNSFGKKNKAVFLVEYRSYSSSLCSQARTKRASMNFSNYDLTKFTICN